MPVGLLSPNILALQEEPEHPHEYENRNAESHPREQQTMGSFRLAEDREQRTVIGGVIPEEFAYREQ